ncbi:XrtA/PEP-CTERM system-associated ATPase [Erythrobacter sp. YT30]|uniref:XrtA/PEP-CTERM system-associated ATPase n=1 Tax=Erythrobacter sp. YT30 TaxID=1735012 RepID=UPI00076CEEC9|nr:XrtA/PEP-CTERM system-associated ATPase [Erythrobacter sp. YT30]KWV93077.1 general secretion pathway protein [Erythrobacter sp. YT30]
MYDQYYGFSGRPFQLTPDPQFYFESATHKKAMSYLGYGLNQAEGFIVITGEVGAGKSTLVAHLMERIDRNSLNVAQVVTSALDGEEIIHVVAQAFGLEVAGHDKAGALGALERMLQDEARAGRRCLLIVDECQNLNLEALEELRMLSNFQLGAHPLMQSLLLGQPEFRRTLAHHPCLDQLRQRIIASHHLEALDEDELESYVTHRMKRVGWAGRPALDEGLLPALFTATDGIPRRVNMVMNRLLLLGAIETEDRLTASMLEGVLEEMSGDVEGGLEPPEPAIELTGEMSLPKTAEDVPVSAGDVPAAEVAALLAERDARTAKLEQAVAALQAKSGATASTDPDLTAAIERIEKRLDEQERSLRHVLTMLIEWLEDDSEREAA